MIISPKEAGIHAREESMMPYAGLPAAETPAPSSHNTSITDAVMSLPDLLRARSAQLVGALELGAPLGRGSFGKVYKGALLPRCPWSIASRLISEDKHSSGSCALGPFSLTCQNAPGNERPALL